MATALAGGAGRPARRFVFFSNGKRRWAKNNWAKFGLPNISEPAVGPTTRSRGRDEKEGGRKAERQTDKGRALDSGPYRPGRLGGRAEDGEQRKPLRRKWHDFLALVPSSILQQTAHVRRDRRGRHADCPVLCSPCHAWHGERVEEAMCAGWVPQAPVFLYEGR